MKINTQVKARNRDGRHSVSWSSPVVAAGIILTINMDVTFHTYTIFSVNRCP